METRGRSKRLRRSSQADEQKDQSSRPEENAAAEPVASTSTPDSENRDVDRLLGLELSLQVKWMSSGGIESAGKTRINRLSLKRLETVDKLGGLSKGLMDRAFPADSRPEYLTDDMFYLWTPDETCLSYPLDVTRTEFKLVAMYNGWEYVILSHELGNPVETADRKLFVTVIEFESVAVVLGNLGIRVSLVAYPVICVQKNFLDDVKQQLMTNKEYKGILT